MKFKIKIILFKLCKIVLKNFIFCLLKPSNQTSPKYIFRVFKTMKLSPGDLN